ncbi:MAG: 4Fe-4S dicluster domain-containing protein [Chloroflexota bacterium]|nr:4Fe-4S dicluster domain-containing protein [Chloroflexota bacterium]
MAQRLIVDVEKCTECRACELRCSFVHFGVFNSNKSGVRIVSDWPELPWARLCVQCDDPACLSACPVEALVLAEAGVVKVVYEECIGCGDCVEACPFDGIWLDPLSEVAVKCDTCDGRFECVPDCFAEALSVGE